MREGFCFPPRVELQVSIARKLLACGVPQLYDTVCIDIADKVDKIENRSLSLDTSHIVVGRIVCDALLTQLRGNNSLLTELGAEFFRDLTFDLVEAITHHDPSVHMLTLITLRHQTNNGWFTEVKNLAADAGFRRHMPELIVSRDADTDSTFDEEWKFLPVVDQHLGRSGEDIIFGPPRRRGRL